MEKKSQQIKLSRAQYRLLKEIKVYPMSDFAIYRVTFRALEKRGLIEWRLWNTVPGSAFPKAGYAWHITKKGIKALL